MRAAELPTVCGALSDPTRWAILRQLGQGSVSASALARVLPVSRQAIGKHLEVLREVGLVEPEQRGREVVYLAVGARLSALAGELDRIGRSWESRLLRIQQLAERPDEVRSAGREGEM